MSIKIAIFCILMVGGGLSAPAEGPIRIDLPVYNEPQDAGTTSIAEPKEASSDVFLVQPLEPENHPGGDLLKNSQRGQNFDSKVQALTTLLSGTHSKPSFDFGGPFSAPVTTRDTVLLETEGYGSKTLSFKENIQNKVAGLFQPKPIVDTISESEKYGNTGDKFYVAGKALVGGAEGVSNLVNSILEVPSSLLKKITRTATEKLNNFGGMLIGL